ncbi:MAG: tRNA (guanosine(46)-N7)-methyltransferase TrmB [Verrucomicrobia bacterium]|nr:tRNA (guanosine(46)-N7)-methyltransferase TrmB [Verrucomicrobiota bacterium]MDA1088047.1 tRNA (guanosine(46)-N7)-methyltransferase TrmB [Verrucomicrobiota bacterium]
MAEDSTMTAVHSTRHGHPANPAMIVPPCWTTPLPMHELFDAPRPLVLDVGCGKGRFLAMRASRDPDRNYLGIERQLVRVRKVARKIQRLELHNARVIRVEASYAVEFMIPPHCVSELFVFFPDPWPKARHHKRRTFRPEFLNTLDRILLPGGSLHVATDHEEYFQVVRDLFEEDDRFEPCTIVAPADDERTEFELIFSAKGDPVHRCSYARCSRK